MLDKLLHTPEGVRDIHDIECSNKLWVQNTVRKIVHQFGYKTIQTPTFEFFEVYNHKRGTVDEKEMYKFFDRDGNILVLRPDITPSIARAVSKHYKHYKLPIRLSYTGNAYRNNESYQGKLREFTQQGAELVGDGSADADAEIIVLAVKCLLAVGLTEFQIDLGQVEFFKGLVQEAGLNQSTEEQLRLLIDQKNYFGVEELLSKQSMSLHHTKVFQQLPNLFGSIEIIKQARSLTSNQRSLKALDRLEKVYEILCFYGVEKYISFDLGMINQLNYYTGIIFRGYTYGTGVSIVDGGRYDTLLSQFGKDCEAVGFAIIIDELMSSLTKQNIKINVSQTDTLILYKESVTKFAIQLTEQLRNDGLIIELQKIKNNEKIEDYTKDTRKKIGGILYIEEDHSVQVIDLTSKKITKTHLNQLMEGGTK